MTHDVTHITRAKKREKSRGESGDILCLHRLSSDFPLFVNEIKPLQYSEAEVNNTACSV